MGVFSNQTPGAASEACAGAPREHEWSSLVVFGRGGASRARAAPPKPRASKVATQMRASSSEDMIP